MSVKTAVISLFVLALSGAVGWTYITYSRDLRVSLEQLEGRSQLVETSAGPIEFAEAGSGPPILLVHGAGGGFDQGMEIGRPLVERGFRVIAMSRFGYLRTALPADASPAAQADAHASLMDALKISRAAVLGVSAGGPSAMQFAIRHTDRCTALVLLVPLAYRPLDVPASAPALSPMEEKLLMAIVGSDFGFWFASKFARDTVIQRVLGTPPEIEGAASKDDQVLVDRMIGQILPISRRVKGIVNDSAISNSLTRFELEKIRAPTLALSARDDLYGTFSGAQYTASQIAGAKFTGFDNGGHLLLGHSDRPIMEIATFLKSQTAPAPRAEQQVH
jgi:2-hydroxy-6-oxonona-2,4-dienedioate hydrolase